MNAAQPYAESRREDNAYTQSVGTRNYLHVLRLHKQNGVSNLEKRYIFKRQTLFALVDKVKLWASRSGVLHGVKSVVRTQDMLTITTHCGLVFTCRNSKNSRSARWLRNRFCKEPCPKCKIPSWKLEKYSATVFTNSKKHIV